MVLKSRDIVSIPVLNQWIIKGLKYGQLSWTQTFNRMGKSNPYKKIQNIAIGKIAEQAVQKYLQSNQIKFDLKGSTKWYEIDIDDLEINDYQIDIKSNFIDKNTSYIKKKSIGSMLENRLDWYGTCHALVPSDQVASKNRGNNLMKKIYIFVFAEGTINPQSTKHIIHAFWDYRWLKKAEHKNAAHLGHLRLSSSTKKELKVTIYGTTEPKKGIIETITLNHGDAITKNSYHQLFAIYSENGIPDSVLKIESKSAKLTETIKPKLSFNVDSSTKPITVLENEWSSVDVQIDHCYIAGWIKKDDFLVISNEYPRYTKIFEQYQDTLTDNFACKVQELEPITQIGRI